MLTIYKKGRQMVVTKGAFESLHQYTGWAVVSEAPVEAPQEPAVAPGVEGGSNHTPEVEEPCNEPYMAPEDPSPDEAFSDTTEDLSTLSREELLQYASLLGIKVGKKSRKELIRAIQEKQ